MLLDREDFMVVSPFYSMSVVIESEVERPFGFPTYCFEQYVHSKRYITFLLLQFDSW